VQPQQAAASKHKKQQIKNQATSHKMQISQNLDYLTRPPGSNKLYKMIKELPHKAKPQRNKNQKMLLL